jgi:hypothetical protein
MSNEEEEELLGTELLNEEFLQCDGCHCVFNDEIGVGDVGYCHNCHRSMCIACSNDLNKSSTVTRWGLPHETCHSCKKLS